MSDKGFEGTDKMSVEYVSEARGMAEVILSKVHRGPGDWIITGVKGERYSCKPDIFEATYEPAA